MPVLSRPPYDFDIVIVGLGPTGATLANLLAQSGVKTLVLEREPELYPLPRAVHFDDETMRVFQTVGIADKLSQMVRINPGMRFVDGEGNLLLDWPRPQVKSDQQWHTSYRLHQPDLEMLLREALAQYSHCEVITGAELIQATTTNDAVHFTFEHSNKSNSGTTRYLIGCDGANSTVRQCIGTEMTDLGYQQRWLVVDVLLQQDMPELGDHTIQYCDSKHPMTYCRNPGSRRRWEMALPSDQSNHEAIDERRIWQRLSRWINPSVASIERKSVYTFRSAVAGDWLRDRMLLAGDAAHLTPPFMGQGMCAGIRDAANLAWKLASVINNPSRYGVLETYQLERDPHVRSYIATAIKLGKLINSVDPHSAQQLSSGSGTAIMASLTATIGSAFTDWLTLKSLEGCGSLFIQPKLNDNERFDDQTGYQFALITSQNTDPLPIPVFFTNEYPSLATTLAENNAVSMLIRPDRYIAALAQCDAESAALVNAISQYIGNND